MFDANRGIVSKSLKKNVLWLYRRPIHGVMMLYYGTVWVYSFFFLQPPSKVYTHNAIQFLLKCHISLDVYNE